jgi:hypothetical protein
MVLLVRKPTHDGGAVMNGAAAKDLWSERFTSHPSPKAAKDGAPGVLGWFVNPIMTVELS